MPYDVTIITVKPNTHMKALPGVEQWLKANPRKGEFIGCLASEIGDLNKILLLHHYESEADLAADRDERRERRKSVRLPRPDPRHVDRHLRAVPVPAARSSPASTARSSRCAPIC